MVRMKDIADKLKLSPTTVSHVLTGKHERYRIGRDTVQRVRKMAEKMGFQSNALARAFKAQRSNSVALVVGDWTNPFWTGVAMGAQREAEAHGYTLFVCNTEETLEREQRTVAMLAERRVDGLILSPTHLKEEYLGMLQQRKLPFVLVDRIIENLPLPCVRTDNVAGSKMAVDYLAGRGHTSIAYVGGAERLSTFRDRLAGFNQAMASRRLSPAAVVAIEATVENSWAAVRDLLMRRPRPTALYAGNIWITMGALHAIQEAGLSVPRDLEIVGFDDIPRANLLCYPVTTIEQQVDAMGREAFKLLLKVMRGEKPEREVLLQPRLIVR